MKETAEQQKAICLQFRTGLYNKRFRLWLLASFDLRLLV